MLAKQDTRTDSTNNSVSELVTGCYLLPFPGHYMIEFSDEPSVSGLRAYLSDRSEECQQLAKDRKARGGKGVRKEVDRLLKQAQRLSNAAKSATPSKVNKHTGTCWACYY